MHRSKYSMTLKLISCLFVRLDDGVLLTNDKLCVSSVFRCRDDGGSDVRSRGLLQQQRIAEQQEFGHVSRKQSVNGYVYVHDETVSSALTGVTPVDSGSAVASTGKSTIYVAAVRSVISVQAF